MVEVMRATENRIEDRDLFSKAKKVMPGGVNSPVRAFKAVDSEPVFISRASGSRLYDTSGGEFIDFCMSWGAMILGHAHTEVVENLREAVKRGTSFGAATDIETELAGMIVDAVPCIEKVRLTNSGTEAVMGAVRLARAFAGKEKIIKFDGSYHGHADYMLAKKGVSSEGVPDSLGVPEDFTKLTIMAPYNDLAGVEEALKKYSGEIAAIIVEPVAANYGVVVPDENFLPGLRELADKNNVVLIFDEVITGFRLSLGGAQDFFGVKPDLTTLAKITGGGMPAGAFGGKKEIMDLLAPEGGVYQAGTLSGNPVSVTGGITALKILKETDPYKQLAENTGRLCDGIREAAEKYGIDVKVNNIGSMFSVFFTAHDVTDYEKARAQDTNLFNTFFKGLLERGIYLSPSGLESNFLSVAHTDEDIDVTLKAVDEVFGGCLKG